MRPAGNANQSNTALPRLPLLGLCLTALKSHKIWEEYVCRPDLKVGAQAMLELMRARMCSCPALAMSARNPFWAAALKANAQAQEGFGTLASEWQGFVSHRLQEDIALMQRLAQSTPDQALAAYTDFWHKRRTTAKRSLR